MFKISKNSSPKNFIGSCLKNKKILKVKATFFQMTSIQLCQ